MVREWGSGAKTRYETLQRLGLKTIHVGAAQDPEERINAVRRLLPAVSFDADRCGPASTGCATTAGAGTPRRGSTPARCTTRTATAPTPSASSP
jgi:hypothetical protein